MYLPFVIALVRLNMAREIHGLVFFGGDISVYLD